MVQKIKPSDFDFLETLKYRAKHRQNNIIIIVGRQRSGKSWAGLKICEYMDKKFDRNAMCFGMKQFMNFVKNYKRRWILFDEIGVELDSATWWTIPNRIMKYVAETYASRQLNLVMTLPHLSGMLKQTRILSHFIIRMLHPSKGILIGISTDYIHEQLYYKWLQFLEFDRPSPSIIRTYEKKKDEFLSEKAIEWENLIVMTPDTKRISELKIALASGLRGEEYRQAFKEYIELKYKNQIIK